MSLRKQARILGIAPSYLSMLVNGKRKWPDDLRYRYEELVNSVVNTEGKASYEITGAGRGNRTHTPITGQRIFSPYQWITLLLQCLSWVRLLTLFYIQTFF